MFFCRHLLWVLLLTWPAFVSALPNEFTQTGFVTNERNAPIDGAQQVRVMIHDRLNPRGSELLFVETHQVEFDQGWYVVQVGRVERIPDDLFGREALFFSIAINDGEELLPRRSMGKVCILQ